MRLTQVLGAKSWFEQEKLDLQLIAKYLGTQVKPFQGKCDKSI